MYSNQAIWLISTVWSSGLAKATHIFMPFKFVCRIHNKNKKHIENENNNIFSIEHKSLQ